LKERDMVRLKDEEPRGFLNLREAVAPQGLSRYWPSDDLAPFVEHHWIVRWNVAEPQITETLPHPSVHMVLERGRSAVVGVMRRKFSRILEGKGRVVATKFRPGAFSGFVDRPVASFTDRRWSVPSVFGGAAARLEDDALAHDDDLAAIEVVESFLRSLRPVATEAMDLAGRITARIAGDREITRVDQIVNQFGITTRQLQRLFRDCVGVTPKWVIQRYRLIESVVRLAGGPPADLAGLALDLGFADQAHFTRDFKKLVGRSPATYARNLGDPRF
jgi:AraC-like DNA-binding protein